MKSKADLGMKRCCHLHTAGARSGCPETATIGGQFILVGSAITRTANMESFPHFGKLSANTYDNSISSLLIKTKN